MSDKLEALRLEAETLSGLMVQLAENEIDSDSFAVMSDLGENGTEHECDLPITETALRAAAVIGQLLAALEEANSKNYLADMLEWRGKAEAAGRREEHLKADVALMAQRNKDLESDVRVADGIIANHQKLNAELERANSAQDDHINQQQDRIETLEKKNDELGKHVSKQEKLLKATEESLIASVDMAAELEQRLQQPIRLPERYSVDCGVVCDPSGDWLSLDDVVKVLGDAGVEVRSPCPHCNRLLDLTSRPDGAHYCHHRVEGE